jgi:hypothetical protein
MQLAGTREAAQRRLVTLERGTKEGSGGHQRGQGHARRVVTDRAATYPMVLEELLPPGGAEPTGTPTIESRRTMGG